MAKDRNHVLGDLLKIQQHFEPKYGRVFGLMIVHFYLYIIKSTHADIVQKQTLKHKAKSLWRYMMQRGTLLRTSMVTDVLVFVTERNHLQQLLPVTDLLRKKGLRVNYCTYKDYLFKDEGLKSYPTLFIPLEIRKNTPEWQRKEFKKSLAEALAKARPTLSSITEEDLPAMEKAYNDWGLYIQRFDHFMHRLLDRIKTKVAITGYDVPPEGRIFTDILNTLQVPTFLTQHAAISKVDDIFGSHIAKHYLVFGELSKEVLQASGFQSDIYVTGAPYLLPKSAAQKQPVHAENKLKILIAFSGSGHFTTLSNHLACINEIMRIAGRNEKTTEFYIKLHNKDRREYYSNLMEGKPLHNVFFSLPHTGSNDIFDWVAFTDLVITGASTVAIEAMLCSKPVISFDLENAYAEFSFVASGAVNYITSGDDLQREIDKIAARDYSSFTAITPKAKQFVEHYYGPVDGKAAERCADIIYKSIKEG